MPDFSKLPVWVNGDGETVRASRIVKMSQGGDSPLDDATYIHLEEHPARIRLDPNWAAGAGVCTGFYLAVGEGPGEVAIIVPEAMKGYEKAGPSLVDASEPVQEQDDATDLTAAEAMIADLRSELEHQKAATIQAEQRAEALGDMARIHTAGGVLGNLIAKKFPRDGDDWDTHIQNAITAADKLLDHYEDIIEKKIAAYHKAMEETDPAPDLVGIEPDPDETVN